ncbi:MAG: hypothetical protein AB7P22_06670 [Vicinamibacterales bacterium]
MSTSEMSDLLTRSDAFHTAATDFANRATTGAADAAVAEEITAVKTSHTRNGYVMAGAAVLAEYEGEYRRRYDDGLRADGLRLEAQRDALAADLREAAEASQELPPSWHAATTTTEATQRKMLEELTTMRVKSELSGRTRTWLLDRYAQTNDRDDTTETRLIERAVRAGELDRLGIVDDPDHDAEAIRKLQAAVNARRLARVPVELVTAQAALAKFPGLSLGTTLSILRSGQGIAVRPRPALTVVR